MLILFRSLLFGAWCLCLYISAGRRVTSLAKWTPDERVLVFPLHCCPVGWGSTALGALSPRKARSVSLGLAQHRVAFPTGIITVSPVTAFRTPSLRVPSLQNLRSCRNIPRSSPCPVASLLPDLILHLRYHCLYVSMSLVVNSGAFH